MSVFPFHLHIETLGEDVVQHVVRHKEIPVHDFMAGNQYLHVGCAQ